MMPEEDCIMKNNTHKTLIDEKTMESIEKNLDEMREKISPHVTPLTPRQRMKMPKMARKTREFVDKCYEYALKNPEFRPTGLKIDEFETDYKGSHNMRGAINKATQLKEDMADTQLLAGSEAYQTALLFYNYVKLLASTNVSGAKAVYEELRKRFPFGRRKKPEAGNAPQTDEKAV
jgi:hypothetical protein